MSGTDMRALWWLLIAVPLLGPTLFYVGIEIAEGLRTLLHGRRKGQP